MGGTGSMSDKKIIALDSQMLETIQLCPRKYLYSFVENLTGLAVKDYMERGTLVHSALEKYYTNGKNMSAAIQASEGEAMAMSLPVNEVETIFLNMEDYGEFYECDSWETQFTEKSAAKVLYEDEKYQFIYQGIIDLGVTIPRVQGIVPVDHKHTKRRGFVTDLSNQFMGYCWLMGCNNLVRNEIGFQKTLKPEERFRRQLFSYDDERIQEWVDNSIWWIKMLILFIETEKWPMNLSSCTKFDGCIFMDVCTSSPSSREWKKSQVLKIREQRWDAGRKL